MTDRRIHKKQRGIQANWSVFMLFLSSVPIVSCVYDFSPEEIVEAPTLMVVEGDIIAGDYSYFRFSTSMDLSSTADIRYITNANVWVADEDGMKINGAPSTDHPGSFAVNTTNLDIYKKYKFCAEVPGYGLYESSLLPVLVTPQIDSITYSIDDNGEFVQIEVTSDGKGNTNLYYKWTYQEDWEFHVRYAPVISYDTEEMVMKDIPAEEQGKNYYCWNTGVSSGIYVASTERLSENLAYKQRLNKIYKHDQRLSYIYSTSVTQISLSKEAYIYWETLKKNTDQTGGIFSPQPSELKGNLESVTRPGEIVLGYISASTATKCRQYIYDSKIHIYKSPSECPFPQISSVGWFNAAVRDNYLPVTYKISENGTIIKSIAYWTSEECADCRKTGTKNKPSFWPNNHE